MESKPYRYIFFDFDGTLIDPRIGITRSVAYALGKLGTEVEDPDTLTPFIGPPLVWAFQEYCGFDLEKATAALGFYREFFAVHGIHENKLYDGVLPMLERLRASRSLVVATSKLEVFAEQIARNLGFAHCFKAICGCKQDGSRTDKAEVIAYAMERVGCKDPSEIVMVGDRMHDIAGAKKNMIQSIGITYGYGSLEELTTAGADLIAHTVEELEALLNASR